VIEQRIQCAITNTQCHAAVVWIQLAPHPGDSQVAAIKWLSVALVDSVSLHPSPACSRRLGSSDGVEQRW